VRRALQALAAVVLTLGATGILATVALGTSCAEAVEWNGVVYVSVGQVQEEPEPGAALGEGEIPDCEGGGRCAPAGESVEVVRLRGVDPAVAVGARDGVYLAPGTLPALPDHPLHDAVYGSPTSPSYRRRCAEPFAFAGEVEQASGSLWVDLADPAPDQLEELADDGLVLVEVDARTVAEGFDRNGVATFEDGAPVEITARICDLPEVSGPLADEIRPG
jgi:hypothetical protein